MPDKLQMIFKSTLKFWLAGAWWMITRLLVSKKLSLVGNKNNGMEVLNSGLLGTRNLDLHALSSIHLKGMRNIQSGRYFEGMGELRQLHEILYEKFVMPDGDFRPFALSREWTVAFGHIPNIGVLLNLRKFGFLDFIPTSAILASEFSDNILIEAFRGEVEFYPDNHGQFAFSQLPYFLHYFLGQNFIWHNKVSEFQPIEWLANSMYAQSVEIPEKTPYLYDLPTNYIDECEEVLNDLGISSTDWFVTLHVRVGRFRDKNVRSYDISKYEKLVDEIGKMGGKVIRIGKHGEPALSERPFLLDCTKHSNALSRIHVYSIAHAKLFVGTDSGPYAYPRLFGTPSLITNITALGRSMLPGTGMTRYLPSDVIKKGKKLTFSELLESKLAWGTTMTRETLENEQIRIENPSPEVILQSAIDMLENRRIGKEPWKPMVEAIRSKYEWTSSGEFSEFWCERNPEFFS